MEERGKTSTTKSEPAQTPTLRDDLRRAEAYGARGATVSDEEIALIETHISMVYLVGADVYKVKKAVSLGFLDFSTIEKRRAACEAEVELNRRLAPGVYKGVVPVRLDAEGRATLEASEPREANKAGGASDAPIIDWAVHMARMPDAQRADVMLAEGRLTPAHIERIAARLARFHEAARADEETARFGLPSVIGVNVRENFEQTRALGGDFIEREQAEEIERYELSLLNTRSDLFAARINAGRVRDGHGDLRLEHVYLTPEGEVIVLDCIEFNDRFRYADTCSDVAFLSMDLAFCGRVDLAELFLAAYAREADDFDMYPLVDFYEGYRAYVRGKIASMMAGDAAASDEARARAAAEARRYFLLALAAEREPLVPPSVIAVGGVIAAGKSTLARALAMERGAAVVDADRTRKNMMGVSHTQKLTDPSWSGAYEQRFTDEVYREVLRRGSRVLAARRPLVLDASFRTASMRGGARELAAQFNVPFLFIQCVADREVCIARLHERAKGESVSDGRVEIFDSFAASFEPVNELSPEEYLCVDSSKEMAPTLEAIFARVQRVRIAG